MSTCGTKKEIYFSSLYIYVGSKKDTKEIREAYALNFIKISHILASINGQSENRESVTGYILARGRSELFAFTFGFK